VKLTWRERERCGERGCHDWVGLAFCGEEEKANVLVEKKMKDDLLFSPLISLFNRAAVAARHNTHREG